MRVFLPCILYFDQIKKGLCTTCCIYTPVLWKSVFFKCCMSVSNFTFLLRSSCSLTQELQTNMNMYIFTNGVSQLCDKASCRNCISCMTQVQNLNKLINSCGDREVEQVSGLLAVQGWSVPWERRKQFYLERLQKGCQSISQLSTAPLPDIPRANR